MPDANHDKFQLLIVTPDKTLFEGESTRVIAPGIFQEIAVLPDHTPLYAQLIKGDIKVKTGNDEQTFPVESGIIRVKQNRVSIVLGF
jgi:F-type H+-transporting ATPase subunit epsilon